MRKLALAGVAAALLAGALLLMARARPQGTPPEQAIQHVVVLFNENVSFDHYFATYPHAANPPGEPAFTALPDTPAVDGLSGALLTDNPTRHNPLNGADATNPFRLDRSDAATTDQNHSYTQEQLGYDHGKMDLYPLEDGSPGPPPTLPPPHGGRGIVMGYYDGNTVTALWNYAQHYAISDRFFSTVFGPSAVGAINLVSGQNNGIVAVRNGTSPNVVFDGGAGSFTLMGDADPVDDVCSSSARVQLQLGGRNLGDMLNDAGITWGWFNGGFDLTRVDPNGSTGCNRALKSAITGQTYKDYVAHHQPFQYYASTANPKHTRPSSMAAVGRAGDAANHEYDLEDFFSAVEAGSFPQVSFLKPQAIQNGHAGYSDPLDEQHLIVRVVNFLEQRPEWAHTALFITWDDTDGWYDHVEGPIVNSSVGPADALTADGLCGDGRNILPGIDPNNLHALARCGYGPRLPLMVISPWARSNYVDHGVTDQTSILRFIEDHFLDRRRIGQGSFDALAGSLDPLFDFSAPPHVQPLILDPATGEAVSGH